METGFRRPSWLRQVAIVLGKDLLIEAKSKEVTVTSGFFALLCVVLSSVAYFVGPNTRAQVTSGAIWLSVAFAAVLSLSRSWQREREEGALDALLVSPIKASALFMGKALGLLLFLLVIEAVVIPTAALFFAVDLLEYGPGILLIAAIATPGIAASGTLFGVMTVRTKARDLIVSVVLFPLLAPTLLAAVTGTRELLDGASGAELIDYLRLMGVFDLTFIVGGLGLFGILAEN